MYVYDVYACMYVCMYVCIYVCMYVRKYVYLRCVLSPRRIQVFFWSHRNTHVKQGDSTQRDLLDRAGRLCKRDSFCGKRIIIGHEGQCLIRVAPPGGRQKMSRTQGFQHENHPESTPSPAKIGALQVDGLFWISRSANHADLTG